MRVWPLSFIDSLMPPSPATHLPTVLILQRMSSPTLEKLPLFDFRARLYERLRSCY